MKTQQHTPGPWTLGNTLVPFGITVWKEHDPERNTPMICKNVSTLANAHLISAAPDLLRALRDLATGENQVLTSRLVDAAFKAISKAEGKA